MLLLDREDRREVAVSVDCEGTFAVPEEEQIDEEVRSSIVSEVFDSIDPIEEEAEVGDLSEETDAVLLREREGSIIEGVDVAIIVDVK